MRLRRLSLKNFGPFKRFSVAFPEEDQVCVLLTGKNNEGKSSIIRALNLLQSGTKVINKKRQEISIEGDYFYRLLQQDIFDIQIARMIHDYSDEVAEIVGTFDDNFKLSVYLNPKDEMVYADYEGQIPKDLLLIFGIVPTLGPLSENEDIISNTSHLNASMNTSLAPRHLRNHMYQKLSQHEFSLVKEIIKKSWKGIELLDLEVDSLTNKIHCYYKENGVDREIGWSGQGLQVWFQAIVHIVRLRDSAILILDEPEINLHPEKQNDLVRILREYCSGSVLVATHSIELMNNVCVSHIINIQKKNQYPKLKGTHDRTYLELVRSEIGSNFNLIASQFEEYDLIIFTEDVFDFKILNEIAIRTGILKKRVFNIPIHGFMEYKKCKSYKEAYKLLIGKEIQYSLVLDRDYYPEEYLLELKKSVESEGIVTLFTPGKELENIFLLPSVINDIIPKSSYVRFEKFWNKFFEDNRLDCQGSFLTLHLKFLKGKLDPKTISTMYLPHFERKWNDPVERNMLVDGKKGLSAIKQFLKMETGRNLTDTTLFDSLLKNKDIATVKFIQDVYRENF